MKCATNVCLYAWNPVAFSTNCNDKKKKNDKRWNGILPHNDIQL